MSLRDRINNPDRRTSDVQPAVERREQPERRVPAWIARKQQQGLPPKDMTSLGTAA